MSVGTYTASLDRVSWDHLPNKLLKANAWSQGLLLGELKPRHWGWKGINTKYSYFQLETEPEGEADKRNLEQCPLSPNFTALRINPADKGEEFKRRNITTVSLSPRDSALGPGTLATSCPQLAWKTASWITLRGWADSLQALPCSIVGFRNVSLVQSTMTNNLDVWCLWQGLGWLGLISELGHVNKTQLYYA